MHWLHHSSRHRRSKRERCSIVHLCRWDVFFQPAHQYVDIKHHGSNVGEACGICCNGQRPGPSRKCHCAVLFRQIERAEISTGIYFDDGYGNHCLHKRDGLEGVFVSCEQVIVCEGA